MKLFAGTATPFLCAPSRCHVGNDPVPFRMPTAFNAVPPFGAHHPTGVPLAVAPPMELLARGSHSKQNANPCGGVAHRVCSARVEEHGPAGGQRNHHLQLSRIRCTTEGLCPRTPLFPIVQPRGMRTSSYLAFYAITNTAAAALRERRRGVASDLRHPSPWATIRPLSTKCFCKGGGCTGFILRPFRIRLTYNFSVSSIVPTPPIISTVSYL